MMMINFELAAESCPFFENALPVLLFTSEEEKSSIEIKGLDMHCFFHV